MKCAICGRLLKSAASRDLGYGPVCYRRKFGSKARIGKEDSVQYPDDSLCYEIPGQMTLDDFLPSDEK
jgi:hypothetical protein